LPFIQYYLIKIMQIINNVLSSLHNLINIKNDVNNIYTIRIYPLNI
jgi:hypothetical protein